MNITGYEFYFEDFKNIINGLKTNKSFRENIQVFQFKIKGKEKEQEQEILEENHFTNCKTY